METRLNKKEVFLGLLSGFLANLLGVIITVIILFQNFDIFKIINDSISENFITKLIMT